MRFPFNQEIILENSFALLRPLQISDVDNLLNVAMKDRDLLQFSPMPVCTKELLEGYIGRAVNDRQISIRYPFSIFDKIKKAYAGSTSFLNVSEGDSRLEIGSTWIGKDFQKTGLNRNCKSIMLSFAFDNLNACRVEFKTDERNVSSRIAIENIGGKFEGILRSHTLMFDGFRRNTVCYSILQNEWIKLKSNFLGNH